MLECIDYLAGVISCAGMLVSVWWCVYTQQVSDSNDGGSGRYKHIDGERATTVWYSCAVPHSASSAFILSCSVIDLTLGKASLPPGHVDGFEVLAVEQRVQRRRGYIEPPLTDMGGITRGVESTER